MTPPKVTRRQKPSSDECRASVFARSEALQAALRDTNSARRELTNACESAATLAELHLPELGITRIGSRNTLYKYANEVLNRTSSPDGDTGWKYLDWLRKAVRTAVAEGGKARTGEARKARAAKRQQRETDQLTILKVAMIAQSKAYLRLLKEIAGIANGKNVEGDTRKRLLNLLAQHDEVFGALFGPDVATEVRPKNVENLR